MHNTKRVSVKLVSARFVEELETEVNRTLAEILDNVNEPEIIDIKFNGRIAMIIYSWMTDPRNKAERLPERTE